MKKALIASTALILSAGVAAADVKLSGFARTGLDYIETRIPQETVITSRVRLNVLGTASTDQGVEFGARLRFQWDQGDAALERGAPGQVFVTASGLTVAVGNVGTAFDNAGLIYASDIGLLGRSLGSPIGDFYAYSSKGYGTGNENRVGISATYSVDDLTARLSYVDPDQTESTTTEEIGVSVDYKWNDVALSAAAVKDGQGLDGNDQYFLGAAYTLPGTSNTVGLNWIDNNTSDTFTLYGTAEVAPLTTVTAYVANNDEETNSTDWAAGIGGAYDLGGASILTAIHRDYNKNVIADFGVRFDF
ncbi:MAG: porin [Paracoccus sp. (in: a-proteobacteria)]|nr:porin [Paracoccus sp. (in: a-proteobacteria)]